MDRKRSRDPDEADASILGKRTRLGHDAEPGMEVHNHPGAETDIHSSIDVHATAAAALASSNVMQAVAHEALAMSSNGTSTSALAALASAANSLTNRNQAIANAEASAAETASDPVSTSSNNNNNNNNRPKGNVPMETLSDITRCFRGAVLSGWDMRSPTYEAIDVLLVYWEEDGEDVRRSTAHLGSVFRNSYHYTTELLSIPSANAADETYARINDFFSRNNSPGHLAILYYAGQVIANRQVGEPPLWTPRRQTPNVCTIESRALQMACENVTCDVLLFFDCCSAYLYPLNKSIFGNNRRNVVEVIDAQNCDPNGEVLAPPFTSALIDALEAAAQDAMVPVDELHFRVCARMTPRGLSTEQTRKLLPKHYWLFKRRTILLTPLPGEPQVVLCLRVLSGGDYLNKWGQWIYEAPPHARETVRVEGVFSGFSTIIVLRVPVSEWHAFAECPAGSLVGFTTIGQMDADMLESIEATLLPKLWPAETTAEQQLSPEMRASAAGTAVVPETPQHGSTSMGPAHGTPLTSTSPHSTIPSSQFDAEHNGVGAAAGESSSASSGFRFGQKKARKALPTARKILPSESSSPLAGGGRRKDSIGERSSSYRGGSFSHQPPPPLGHHHHHLPPHNQLHDAQQLAAAAAAAAAAAQSGETGEGGDKTALLAAAAQKPFKISIKLASQSHVCQECKGSFKDPDSLHNHVRKQHTRPFQCVFNWAGCESTFASKNEWKRHVMSQHILLQYWVCQVDMCAKNANKVGGAAGGPGTSDFSLPNGAIFNRKDLFTQHLRRMHTPPHVKKLLKQAKQGAKLPNHPSILEWENRLKELQQHGLKPRCRLPEYMICPVQGCGADFHGNNAWDDRMEHVARHLECAAAGREPPVVFGGKTDTTLTNWATRPEVGIAKRIGPDMWHLDNPLRPEIMAWTEESGKQYQFRMEEGSNHNGNHPSNSELNREEGPHGPREVEAADRAERPRSVIEVADSGRQSNVSANGHEIPDRLRGQHRDAVEVAI